MADSNSIVSFGDFGKPADTLITKISDAIGGIFKPYQIRRVAQAEAEADKIHAVAQIEISELQNRALRRFLTEEAKKQSNIEDITSQALPDVSEDAKPEKMEDDWITNFFDKCRLISDKEMQSLWSKILAGEANSPGKYSKRTVNALSSLDKSDAELFSKLCAFGFIFDTIMPLVYDTNHQIYEGNGITFTSLTHLESIGLIRFDTLSGFRIINLQKTGSTAYNNKIVLVDFPNAENNEMNVGQVLLTKLGRELTQICSSTPIDGFLEYVMDKWKSFGYKTKIAP